MSTKSIPLPPPPSPSPSPKDYLNINYKYIYKEKIKNMRKKEVLSYLLFRIEELEKLLFRKQTKINQKIFLTKIFSVIITGIFFILSIYIIN